MLRLWYWFTGRRATETPTIADAYCNDTVTVPALNNQVMVAGVEREVRVPALNHIVHVPRRTEE